MKVVEYAEFFFFIEWGFVFFGKLYEGEGRGREGGKEREVWGFK